MDEQNPAVPLVAYLEETAERARVWMPKASEVERRLWTLEIGLTAILGDMLERLDVDVPEFVANVLRTYDAEDGPLPQRS
jgi:hypothetical protein